MTVEIFADSIGEIALTGSVVRLDLVSLSVTERDENKKPKPEFRQRVVMPVEGFVQSFALMAQIMQQLEKNGVIQKAPANGGKPAVQVKPAIEAKPNSPNFK